MFSKFQFRISSFKKQAEGETPAVPAAPGADAAEGAPGAAAAEGENANADGENGVHFLMKCFQSAKFQRYA